MLKRNNGLRHGALDPCPFHQEGKSAFSYRILKLFIAVLVSNPAYNLYYTWKARNPQKYDFNMSSL